MRKFMATATSSRDRSVFFSWLTIVFLLILLFSIDEGTFGLGWMTNIGNWIVFLVYIAVITALQVLTEQFVFRPIVRGWPRAILSAATGMAGGLVISFYLFS